jgi:hypothetical protein
MAVAGPVADAVGVRTLFMAGGLVQIVLGLGGLFVPAIMHLEDGQGARTVEKKAMVPSPAPDCAAAE